MAFFIWCCRMTWFHLLIVYVINWKLIWSQIFYHEQSDGCGYIIKFWCLQNAPTSRFGFASFWCKEDETWSTLLFYLFILFIFNNGLGFTGTQGFRSSEIWASFVPMLYITDLSSKMSSHGFNHMTHAQFYFILFFSWALGPHGLDHTQKAFPPDCKPTLVLLGKLVPQLSCPASFFIFYFFLSRTLTNR